MGLYLAATVAAILAPAYQCVVAHWAAPEEPALAPGGHQEDQQHHDDRDGRVE